MAKTDIRINSTEINTGKKITTSVPYVNATASAAALVQFGRQLNALTTNTYISTEKVVTTRLDDEEASNNG